MSALGQDARPVDPHGQRYITTMEEFLERKGNLPTGQAIYALVRQAAPQRYKDNPDLDMGLKMIAYQLAINGFSPSDLNALKKQGLDLAEIAITESQIGSPPVQSAAVTPLVVIAKVVGYEETLEPGDGYRSTLFFEVKEVLRGEVSSQRIALRRRSGAEVYNSADIPNRIGAEYLLFLSNELYRYMARFPDQFSGKVRENIPEEELARYYEMNGGFLPMAYVTEEDIEQIREVDRLIKSVLR